MEQQAVRGLSHQCEKCLTNWQLAKGLCLEGNSGFEHITSVQAPPGTSVRHRSNDKTLLSNSCRLTNGLFIESRMLMQSHPSLFKLQELLDTVVVSKLMPKLFRKSLSPPLTECCSQLVILGSCVTVDPEDGPPSDSVSWEGVTKSCPGSANTCMWKVSTTASRQRQKLESHNRV